MYAVTNVHVLLYKCMHTLSLEANGIMYEVAANLQTRAMPNPRYYRYII